MAIRTETDRAAGQPPTEPTFPLRARDRSRVERARAERYLDLWERNVANAAVHAQTPGSVAGPRDGPAKRQR